MHILSKIILFLFSSLCLFVLVFFTFIIPSYNVSIQTDYQTLEPWTYIVDWEYPHYTIKPWSIWNNELKMLNLSTWNHIYYYQWNIQANNNEITLETWIYFFDINSLNFNKKIIINWAVITPHWPWTFIINTNHSVQKSIYSISSKIEINLHDPNDIEKKGTLLDLYPNMFVMYNTKLNKQIINADLLRIQNVQYLDMINTSLYEENVNDSWEINYTLHPDIIKYVFFENEENYDFIKNIWLVNKYKINLFKNKFIQLSKNNVYSFPWSKYIIKYYWYFLNDEKKKIYTKNIILKELISMINWSTNNNWEIQKKLAELKELDEEEYNNMISTINYYYENILYSQHDSSSLLIIFSKLIWEVTNQPFSLKYPSLLSLRNIYDKYHNNDIYNFHTSLNAFVDQYEVEMNMSIYDKNHRIHSYFLYFIKNILIADFSKVEDHNDIVTLFKKYIDIKNVFIEKWDNNTKKTALFDNAQLLKVFVDITKLNFFEQQRDDQWLLVLLKPASITNENYIILEENLNKLIDFYKKYQYFIENSTNRKDIILQLSYTKYIDELKEYFLALSDYNEYVLEYDTAAINPIFESEKNENILSKDDAVIFLKQFNGVSSIDTDIQIRWYGYCVQPIEANNIPIENPEEWYCFKIWNLAISWYIFEFVLIPSEQNTISNLSYTDLEWNKISIWTNYVMDQIQEDMLRKYSSAQSSVRDRYDYKQFFKNNFIHTQEKIIDNSFYEELENEFTPPDSGNDSIQERRIKLSLLSENSYLAKIRDIVRVSYDYLLLNRENDEYIAQIFPTDFQLTITGPNNLTSKFLWKFWWIYNYWSSDNENTFKSVSLILRDPTKTKELIFLMNKTPININGTFKVTQTELLLTKLLSKYGRIESVYSDLYNIWNERNIQIEYNINKNIVTYTLENGTIIEYNMEWLVNVYTNNRKTATMVYNKLWTYLETLE